MATTFFGVCNKHDTEIFKPIELIPFTGATEQLFLFHYRSVLFEYYRRHFQYQKLEKMGLELLKSDYASDAKNLYHALHGNECDKDEISAAKSKCDQMFQNRNYSGFHGRAWRLDHGPPIVGTLTFAPHKDFTGKRLQRPIKGRSLEWVSLTISIKDGRGLVIIGSEQATATSRAFVDSLDILPVAHRMHAVVVYALAFMENAVYLPFWWEGLSKQQREAVIRISTARIYPYDCRSFGDWQTTPV